MADGITKPIKNSRIGDKVLATDPTTGATRVQTVTELHINQDTDLADVTVQTPDGRTTTLHTTWHHPFWDTTTKQWVNAENLRIGHKLRGLDAGALSTVVAVRLYIGSQQMRDLTISTTHTYYVLAGDTPVLVHNCGTGEISDEVMNEHILPRHSLEQDHLHPEFADKSKFVEGTTPDQIRQWSRDAMKAPIDKISMDNGAHRHLYDTGEVIGFDGETHVAVWVENGQVTSVHPEFP